MPCGAVDLDGAPVRRPDAPPDLRSLAGDWGGGRLAAQSSTARNVVSRWDVVTACRRATSVTATRFLEMRLDRMPLSIQACQVDGGREFAAAFRNRPASSEVYSSLSWQNSYCIMRTEAHRLICPTDYTSFTCVEAYANIMPDVCAMSLIEKRCGVHGYERLYSS